MTTQSSSTQRVLNAIDNVLPNEAPPAPEAKPAPESADLIGTELLTSGESTEPKLLTTGEVALVP